MSRKSFKFFNGIVFALIANLLCIASESYGQPSNKIIPQYVDISVVNISIKDPKSSVTILGKHIKLVEPADDLPHAKYYNKNRREILIVYFHPGDTKNSFSEFRVKKVEHVQDDIPLLDKIEHFTTGKHIKIGISKKELIKILGKSYTSNAMNDMLIFQYSIDDFKNSAFLKFYNMPLYYGKYKFKNDRLVEFSFGFAYP